MIRDFFIYMGIHKITIIIVWHRDFTDVRVELVMCFITVPIGLIGSYCLFIPFTGKDTLATNIFETFTNATDPSKQVNKLELILTVMFRGGGDQPL